MSGHSKWSTIKRKKGVADAARGKLFTKLTNAVTAAAQNGGDPDANADLRLAIDKARAENVPKDNIEKAIKRGTGELEGVALESFSYDAVGPDGLALIIQGVTDNKNRTISELRLLLSRHQSKLAQSGSQSWQFDRRGIIEISLAGLSDVEKDQAELTVIESGAQDAVREQDNLIVFTLTGDLKQAVDKITAAGLKVTGANLNYVAKNNISLAPGKKEVIEELLLELEENGDIQTIATNLA